MRRLSKRVKYTVYGVRTEIGKLGQRDRKVSRLHVRKRSTRRTGYDIIIFVNHDGCIRDSHLYIYISVSQRKFQI